MDYQVVTMEDFQLLGKGEMQLVGQVKADLFWQKCQKDGTLAKLTTYSTSDEKEWIGLADGESFDGEGYMYYIATHYHAETVPSGYTTLTLPSSLWIKFRSASLNVKNTADKDCWTWIFSDFFPASEYEPAGFQLEVYPKGAGSYPDSLSEIWISVKKSSD